MSMINVNSLDDIKGPGTYVVPYNYVAPDGKLAKFHFIVNVGNLDANSKITLAGYGGAGTNTSVDPMMTNYINYKNSTGNNGIDLVIRYNNSRSGYEPVVWESAASQFMQQVSDKFNVSTDNTTLIGYSYSAEKTLKYAGTYAMQNDAHNMAAVVIESSWGKPLSITNEQRQALIDNNVTVFNVYQIQNRSVFNHVSNLQGVHVVDVEISDGTGRDLHFLPWDIMMGNGLIGLSNGNFDFTKLPTTYNSRTMSYKFIEHYVDENGNYVSREITADQAQDIVEGIYTANIESLYAKYDNLADFASHFKGNNSTLASNLSFVSNAMNNLKSQITEHTDISYTASTGEASVIDTLYKASNYYGSVTNILYGNLQSEADAVYKIANEIFKMDKCASVIAETTLTGDMKTMFNSVDSDTLELLNKTSSELYDTAKNAILANGRYDDLKNILGNTAKSGSVGRISIDSLNSAINAIVPNLDAEINKATSLKAGVSDFITGIGNNNLLQGETWEAVKTNMNNYESLLDCNVKAATFIGDTIKTAMGLITDYITNASSSISAVSGSKYSNLASANELDDSKLGELDIAISEVEKNIGTLSAKITEMRNATTQKCTDPEDKSTCKTVSLYSAADIAPFEKQLEEAENLKNTLNEYRGILTGFADVVANAQKMINDAIEQVKDAYAKPVNNTENNQPFTANFKLDLSAYGADTSKDYKKLIEDKYIEMNKPPETPVVPGADQTAGNNDTNNGNNGYKPRNHGGYSGYTPAPSTNNLEKEKSTKGKKETIEITSEIVTEMIKEEATEVIEKSVNNDSNKNVVIEVATEPINENAPLNKETKPAKKNYTNKIYGTSKGNSGTKKVETKVQDVPVENNVEPIIDDNIYDAQEYVETVVEDPVEEFIAEEVVPVVDTPTKAKEEGNGIKTLGIASGIGLSVGAAALGAHAMMNKKDDEDSDEDYGYEK